MSTGTPDPLPDRRTRRLTDAEIRVYAARDHLTKDRLLNPHGGNGGSNEPINSRTEFYCLDCGSRVTVGPGGVEYGHSPPGRAGGPGQGIPCPHRPTGWPSH